jgi:hypothetical protein
MSNIYGYDDCRADALAIPQGAVLCTDDLRNVPPVALKGVDLHSMLDHKV